MKRIRVLFLLAAVLFLLLANSGMACAAGFENYGTYPVSDQEKTEFLESIQFTRSDVESATYAISCFAISDQGLIALGFNPTEYAIINIYNSSGEFLYSYSFRNRSAYTVFFEGEDLGIYWVRAEYIGSFDANGNCVQLGKDDNSRRNHDAYHMDKYPPSSGKIGGLQYEAEGALGMSSYTRFTIEDDAGNRTVIYDVAEDQTLKRIIVGILIVSFVPICLIGQVRKWQRIQDQEEEQQ